MSISLMGLAVLLVAPTGLQPAAPLDTMIDVGGHRLHFVVHRGAAPVTIVMESGAGATLERWGDVPRQLADRSSATVVIYDRAGFGRSDLGPLDLTPSQEVRQLGRALEQLGVPQRRIVVGQSYGGMLAMLHGEAYAEHVVGLVLLDPLNARFVDATGDFVYTIVPNFPDPKNDLERALARTLRTLPGLVPLAREAEERVRAPVVVVTASSPPYTGERERHEWRRSHETIVTVAPGRRLVVAENSGHQIALDRPDVVVDAVVSQLEQKRE